MAVWIIWTFIVAQYAKVLNTSTENLLNLMDGLSDSLKKLLRKPDVTTDEVITGYISTIKSLRHLDASARTLQHVSEPVLKYLRSQDDTMLCILSSLTNHQIEVLAYHLANIDWPRLNTYEARGGLFQCLANQKCKPLDGCNLLIILIVMYEENEIHVVERDFQKLLGFRLMSRAETCDLEQEFHYLELLRRRFGENYFHAYEVMLKEVEASGFYGEDFAQDMAQVLCRCLKNDLDWRELPELRRIACDTQYTFNTRHSSEIRMIILINLIYQNAALFVREYQELLTSTVA